MVSKERAAGILPTEEILSIGRMAPTCRLEASSTLPGLSQ
jgi:hypothetical protein